MANLSKERRERMISFLNTLRKANQNNASQLRAINEIEQVLNEKKYGLIWEEHSENVDDVLSDNILVFDEVSTLKLLNSESEPWNFILEGDNLHSLKLLEKTHKGSIDLIYIDPPYNTGNKDFRYDDTYVDKVDGYNHSKWISFMVNRLKCARNLLSEAGIIFISIDDNEQAQLRLICDEIFGDSNFVAQIIPIANPGGRDYKDIAITHEYLLVYTKGPKGKINEIPKDIEFTKFDKKGGYELRELRNRNPKFNSGNRPNLFYPIFVAPSLYDEYGCNKISTTKSDVFNIEVKPYNSKGEESVWRWGKPKLIENLTDSIDEDEVVARQKKDGNWNVYEKSRKVTTKAKSVWNETEMRTEEGTRLIMSLFGKSVFDHPKSLSLIKRVIELGSKKDSVILDFFAGSGTTGHAVMALNKEDSGSRRYILCTNNENNICEEVTYQRLLKIQDTLPHNIKYLKAGVIEKTIDMPLSYELLPYIKPLVELENACDIDSSSIQIFLMEDEFDEFMDKQEFLGLKKVFLASDILLSSDQERTLQAISCEVIRIPEYYYTDELIENGEL